MPPTAPILTTFPGATFLRLGWLGLLLFLVPASPAADTNFDSQVTIAPPSAWVRPLMFERPSREATIDAGEDQRWLLLQRDINARDEETFVHSVRQLRNVAGVQNGSQVTFDFDPSYQSVILHWVRIWRGTNFLDRLDREQVKLTRQERELEGYLFNGRYSVMLVLPDVRAGDIIDYAYTIRGRNPVFDGKFFEAVAMRSGQPVERLTTRLLWPANRRLFLKSHGKTVPPTIVRRADLLEYTWDVRKVPALRMEDSVPVWYDPWPWVQLSEFQTWAEVNQWAMKLFPAAAVLTPELVQRIEEWRRLPQRTDRIQAVLRFLQDEVRYFGVEMGPNSHRPSDPATVFNRRFGDCKDKSFLFVTILRRLGIDASPVLVSTGERRMLDGWQPTPGAFDHVIAQVRLEEQTFWLDPTRSYQGGPLAARFLPDLERGLVLRPGTTALAVIPRTAAPSATYVTEYLQLNGWDQTAELKVVTVAEGGAADALRELFATTTRDRIEKANLNFYTHYHPGTRRAGPIQFIDDEARNRVETTEYYTVERMWVRSSTGKYHYCQLSPHNLMAVLQKPADLHRTTPVGLSFPQYQTFRLEVTLPILWPGKNEFKNIPGPAFYYQKRVSRGGRKLVMDCEYRALADSVPLDGVADYLRQLDEVGRDLSYVLIWE